MAHETVPASNCRVSVSTSTLIFNFKKQYRVVQHHNVIPQYSVANLKTVLSTHGMISFITRGDGFIII